MAPCSLVAALLLNLNVESSLLSAALAERSKLVFRPVLLTKLTLAFSLIVSLGVEMFSWPSSKSLPE